MSFSDFFVILLALGVLCLLALFPFVTNAARFACLTPSWRLPVHGSVVHLVAAY